jgi:hypothetical protein
MRGPAGHCEEEIMVKVYRCVWIVALAAAVLFLAGIAPATAGVVIYEEGHKKIEIGGRIQVQYARFDPDEGESKDDLFFRRLRPYIAGTVTEDWYAKIQFDFGKSLDNDEVAVKDAYLRYTGFEHLQITVGNQKPPFSREFLTSSKKLQQVERPFTGDHNFGNPDRFLGVKLDGNAFDKKLAYSVAVGAEDHDPAVGRIDFDTPVNDQSDWNQGWLAAGRIDFHPLGAMKYDQGDFHSEKTKFTVSVAAFVWENDDDRNTYTDEDDMTTSTSKVDLDEATGFELSGGVRTHGFSADVQFNRISGDAVDRDFTGGLYEDGTTDLDQISVVAGYMVVRDHLEITAGWQSQDADGYEEAWDCTSIGLNYFWNKYNVKAQLTYQLGENVNGVDGDDADTIFAQMQFVF